MLLTIERISSRCRSITLCNLSDDAEQFLSDLFALSLTPALTEGKSTASRICSCAAPHPEMSYGFLSVI
jgi:hypothetical protein